ncbi:site-specific integrase [Gelidibacter salicanalis]|uniref:Site-specific integrase n=1 Tax=Gelidibacter salicanalis TaxID=291193 RepID=A0A5C7AL89_9FLAO|nr:site-specific integrase [Gelidibacter salicanalis]TXE08549.1 site-specific integrase [Gelidibacter salicanalis]
MNKNKLSIRFVIVKAKINKNNKCPLSCRLTYLEKRHAFNTGLFVNPKFWVSKNQQVLSTSSQHDYLNKQLQLIALKLNQSFLELQINQNEFTVRDVYKQYKGETIQKEYDTVQFFQEFLTSQEKLIGKEIKFVTWKKFDYVKNDVQSFIKWKFKVSDYPLKSLQLQFLYDFQYYLMVEKNQKQITINKSLQRFRKPIKIAIAEGFLEKDPFLLYKAKTVKPIVVFLDTDELSRLEFKVFDHPKLQLVKNLFIFSCYTGLAYHEIANLESKHIIKGFDGNLWIEMMREKTSKPFSVPLLPKAIEVLNIYQNCIGRIFPKISNQRYNTYLKEIAALTGIDKNLTTHTARKTFASTVLLYNDVPMEIVSELLGHSNMKITQDSYGKIVQRKISIEIEKLKKNLQ